MLRRKRVSVEDPPGDVVALSSGCSACGAALEPGDAYCPACGAPVAGAPLVGGPGLEERAPGESEPGSAGRRMPLWARVALLVVVLAGLAAAFSLLVVAWSGERSERREAERRLAASRAESVRLEAKAEDLRSQLADTESELGAAQSLVEAQETVLAQTERVLGRVDPLLSAVDNLKLLAAQIQDDRDAFRGEAELLRDDLVAFANYLVQTSPFDYDVVYINGQIDYLNGRLDEFAGTAAGLDDRDRDYARASQRFDTRADGYSEAVRRLERALASVSE